jgi:hypothetical protein
MEEDGMNATTSDKAFVLSRDLLHLGDDDYDASLVKFPGWEGVASMALPDMPPFPERIAFEANFRSLQKTDFPSNDALWPLMSRRMLDVLLSVRDFPHRAVPVVMVKDTVMSKDRYDEQMVAKPGVEEHRFVAVHLLEHTDAFDWERSIYNRHRLSPKLVKNIKKLVLKEPDGGFPPLFRLSAYPAPLFVSAAARSALENAGIKGVVFGDLDSFRG